VSDGARRYRRPQPLGHPRKDERHVIRLHLCCHGLVQGHVDPDGGACRLRASAASARLVCCHRAGPPQSCGG
jgi:hypothetical protein